ncbi:MAG: methylated-DNA--[protein]-cysteine S-methyltransferase [Anaerolineae bacterium]|nr:methylated-DNA--[protein]-cysteine S-methyltransferase [Anaerolineae bacterium]
MIRWDVMDSPLGPLYLAASDQGICHVDFGVGLDDFLARLDPTARVERDPAALAPVVAQLREYFAGARLQFEVPIDLRQLTAFQRRVLEATCAIPAGAVRSYRQVAEAIGKPQASHAVGQALARNPVPILIPCHRVIASDGSLGGYGGGLAHKRLLLDLEGARVADVAKIG